MKLYATLLVVAILNKNVMTELLKCLLVRNVYPINNIYLNEGFFPLDLLYLLTVERSESTYREKLTICLFKTTS